MSVKRFGFSEQAQGRNYVDLGFDGEFWAREIEVADQSLHIIGWWQPYAQGGEEAQLLPAVIDASVAAIPTANWESFVERATASRLFHLPWAYWKLMPRRIAEVQGY